MKNLAWMGALFVIFFVQAILFTEKRRIKLLKCATPMSAGIVEFVSTDVLWTL
jgi:hypothetical protein